MNLDDVGSTDECERLLSEPLKQPSNLAVHEKQTLRKALKWYRGDIDAELSLVQWMSVTRLIGEHIAIQLDTGPQYHFLRFDKERNRVVLIDPHENSQVPVEEADIVSLFETASVLPVTARTMQPKTFENLTAVSNEVHGTKVVLGAYEDSFVQYTEEGQTIQYEPEVTFSLPEKMTPADIEEWLVDEAADTLKSIVLKNAEQNWGDSDSK